MNNHKNLVHTLLALACLATISLANAQVLPPVPVSPAPVVAYEYDAEGKPTKGTQAPGVSGFSFSSQRAYDALGRVQTLTDPRSKVTQLLHNGQDQTTQITDPRSLITQYPRNGLGDALQLVSPDTGTAAMTYDGAGNLKTRTDSRGVLETQTWDAVNRLTSRVFSQSGQPSQSFTWTYDQTGTGFSHGIGRLTSTSHPVGSSKFAHDPQGRVVSETQTVLQATGANPAAVTKTVTYTRNANGDITAILFPSGRKLIVTYTGGVPSAMALAKNATATPVPILDQIVHNPFAGPKSWVWQMTTGPQAHDRVFDLSGRLVRYRLGAVVRDVTYDAADRVTSYSHYDAVTAAPVTAQNQVFGYDQNSRLTNVSFGTSTWALTYDDNGKPHRLDAERGREGLRGVADQQPVELDEQPVGDVRPRRRGQHDGQRHVHDGVRFVGPHGHVHQAQPHHDLCLRRLWAARAQVSSNDVSTTAIFVYDLEGHLLGEYASNGTPVREYIWPGDTPVAMFRPGPTGGEPLVYLFHTDHLNTPRAVMDTSGGMRWTWFAEPFGTTAPNTDPAGLGDFVQRLRFPGVGADRILSHCADRIMSQGGTQSFELRLWISLGRTAFHGERGRDFSVIVDGVSV